MLPGFPNMRLETGVPSFLPAMNSVSGAIDRFAERRMQLRQEEERKAQQALAAKIAADKDAYYRGKVAAEERKQAAREKFDIAKLQQHGISQSTERIGKDLPPEPVPGFDEAGNPVFYRWRFTGKKGQRSLPPPPTPPAPQPGSEPEPPPMAAEPPPPAIERATRSAIAPPPLTRPTLGGGPITAPRPAPQGGIPTMMGKPLMPPPMAMATTGPARPTQQPDPWAPLELPETNLRPGAVEAGLEGGIPPNEYPAIDRAVYGQPRELPQPGGQSAQADPWAPVMPSETDLRPGAVEAGITEGIPASEYPAIDRAAYGRPRELRGPRVPGAPSPDTMFLDEFNDGSVRGLTGPGDETAMDLPEGAFPPGAREGERYASKDIGMGGRKGSPFAESMPSEPLPQVERQPMPETLDLTKQAEVTSVPPARVRGEQYGTQDPFETMQREPAAQVQETSEGVWELVGPGDRVITTIDPSQVKRAQMERSMREAMGIDAVIKSQPDIPEQQRDALMFRRNLLLSGLPLKMIHRLGQQQAAYEQQKLKSAETYKLEERKIESREKIAHEAGQIRLTIAQMKKKKGRAGSLLGGRAGYRGGAFEAYHAKDPYKAARIAYYLDKEVQGSLRNFNWQKLEAGGVNRLALALRTIEEGGAGEFEAVMNFFGYVRNGVPAKNETDLWHEMTGTTTTLLNRWGMKLKLGAIGSILSRRNLSAEEEKALKEKYTGLDPDRKAELKRAIQASLDAVTSYAEKASEAIAQKYRGRPQLEQEVIQGKIDELRYFARIPEKTFFEMPGWNRGIDVTTGAAGGGGRSEEGGGKMTDAQLLEALKGMK